MSTNWLTPADIADELGIDVGKVTHWLNSGQLRGVDVSENRNKRRRWRISRQALDEFLAARQSGPPDPKARVRRRQSAEVVSFY